jgi:hypothetical protein
MVLFGVYICIIPMCVNSGYVLIVVGFSDHALFLDCFLILYMCAYRLGLHLVMLIFCKLDELKVAILLCLIIDNTLLLNGVMKL